MRRFVHLLVAAMAAVSLLAAGTTPAYEPTTENLFTHNPNAGCADRSGHVLIREQLAGSNCGYIYGAPIGQIEEETESGVFENAREYTTTEGELFRLDGSRDIEGVVVVASRESFCASPAPVPCVPHGGQGSGLGEIVVDLKVTGVLAGDQFAFRTLGTTTVSGVVLPGQTKIELPYTIAIPSDFDGAEFGSLTFSVDVKGWHVNSGYANASGATTVNVPTLTEVVAS